MRTPKTIIYLIGLYYIISAVIFIIISILAICAYSCAFDFTGSQFSYLMYLLYFRRSSCHNLINWDALSISGASPIDLPEWPQESAAVLRTFTFAVIYLLLNLGLIVAALRAMSGVSETAKNRHMLFWSFYSPLFVFIVAILVCDFISSGFYLVEFFMIFYNLENLLNILELSNASEMRPYFGQLSANTRSLPSIVFFLVASKFVLLLILNMALVYSLFTAVWKVCRDNQKQVLKVHTLSKRKQPSPVMSMRSLDSVHEMPPTLYETYSQSPRHSTQTAPPEPPPRPTPRQSQFSARLDINIDDTKSISSNTTIEEVEIRLPRLSYEKSPYQYPSESDYDQPHDARNTLNTKTQF